MSAPLLAAALALAAVALPLPPPAPAAEAQAARLVLAGAGVVSATAASCAEQPRGVWTLVDGAFFATAGAGEFRRATFAGEATARPGADGKCLFLGRGVIAGQ